MDLEQYLNYVRTDDTALYRMSIDDIEGRVIAALPVLSAILDIDPEAEIVDEGDRWDEHRWRVTWCRPLRPEEIAERERVARSTDAERAAKVAADEQALYLRLKEKYDRG